MFQMSRKKNSQWLIWPNQYYPGGDVIDANDVPWLKSAKSKLLDLIWGRMRLCEFKLIVVAVMLKIKTSTVCDNFGV